VTFRVERTLVRFLLESDTPNEEAKIMPTQTPKQCDELFGKSFNARDLSNLVALYEAQASLVNEDGTTAR